MPRIPAALTTPLAADAPVLAWDSPGAGWIFFLALAVVVLLIGTLFWWWGRRRRRPQDPM